MKYRIFGKEGISEFEHSKLVEWNILKEKPREYGVIPQKKKIRKKVTKRKRNVETGEIYQKLSEKSGSRDSAFTFVTLKEYEYNDNEDFYRFNKGFELQPLSKDIYGEKAA